MKTELYSLSKIFNDYIYRIPDYQRGYSWTKVELFDFWDDLTRLNETNNHYVGVLTLEPVSKDTYQSWNNDIWLINSKSYTPYYVVDGQQRLTTSVILIKAITTVAREKKIGMLNFTSIEEIERKFLYETLPGTNSVSFLFCYEKENPSFNYLSNYIFFDQKIVNNTGDETIYTSNLSEAKEFFIERLLKLDKKDLESIYKKISQRFLFNIYQISEDIDVFVTFETMNNRGKPLSYLELLKNRLIYISTLLTNCPDENKRKIREDINDCWKDIYHYLGKNKNNKLQDDEFLDAHFSIYTYKKEVMEDYLKRNLLFRRYDEVVYQSKILLSAYFVPSLIGSEIGISEISTYIKSLKNSIAKWYMIHNPSESYFNGDIQEYLGKLRYISYRNRTIRALSRRSNFDLPKVFTLLMLTKEKDSKKMLKFLVSLERLLFITSCFSGFYYAVDIENTSLTQTLEDYKKDAITIEDVITKFDKVSQVFTSSDNIKTLVKYYSKEGFYDSQFNIKYFMYEYEFELMKRSKTGVMKLDIEEYFSKDNNTIEHIYPKNARDNYWTNLFSTYSTAHKKIIRNSLGNLVAVSGLKNDKLGNSSFRMKIDNGNNFGFKYGSYSEIELTQYTDWSIKEIKKRGILLVDFLQKRWGIKISDDSAGKLAFLGLNSIK
ncbi:MAG: DUF262 domain-containing HNH endonuclease family protein [Tenericutes bacterium]|nr:DUF262 domain-containing HNH endonuclease family protein [Mycoplasmatota bacterium]